MNIDIDLNTKFILQKLAQLHGPTIADMLFSSLFDYQEICTLVSDLLIHLSIDDGQSIDTDGANLINYAITLCKAGIESESMEENVIAL